jgi:leucyl aminopeptidase
LAGLGKEKKLDRERIRRACSSIVSKVKPLKLETLAIALPKTKKLSDKEVAKATVEGCVMANYMFCKYKKDKKHKEIRELALLGKPGIKDTVNEAKLVCGNTNFVRDLVNEPGTAMNPVKVTAIAREVAKRARMKITVLEGKQLKKRGLNLIISVGKGSRYPPRMVILEYYGNRRDRSRIALAGKGVTFDSGGINLKPSGYIETMKYDKAGAVTVLGVMKTLAELKVKKNVIGIMPLCENMISQDSCKPGDIVESYSGKSIEVNNTDAEGRLQLADALAYAEKVYKPSLVIDIATLTAATLITFGEFAASMVSNSDKLADRLFHAGERTFERVWRLPLYDEYMEETKGEITDVKNLGYKGMYGYYAGVLMAAAFLKNFLVKTPWIHLDIGGTGWYDKARYYIPKGGTGWGVRLITEFIRGF